MVFLGLHFGIQLATKWHITVATNLHDTQDIRDNKLHTWLGKLSAR